MPAGSSILTVTLSDRALLGKPSTERLAVTRVETPSLLQLTRTGVPAQKCAGVTVSVTIGGGSSVGGVIVVGVGRVAKKIIVPTMPAPSPAKKRRNHRAAMRGDLAVGWIKRLILYQIIDVMEMSL